jgi:hypothetical protein
VEDSVVRKHGDSWYVSVAFSVMLFGCIGLPILAALFFVVFVPDTSTSATDLYGLGVFAVSLLAFLAGCVVALGAAVWLLWMSPWRELRKGRTDESTNCSDLTTLACANVLTPERCRSDTAMISILFPSSRSARRHAGSMPDRLLRQ